MGDRKQWVGMQVQQCAAHLQNTHTHTHTQAGHSTDFQPELPHTLQPWSVSATPGSWAPPPSSGSTLSRPFWLAGSQVGLQPLVLSLPLLLLPLQCCNATALAWLSSEAAACLFACPRLLSVRFC